MIAICCLDNVRMRDGVQYPQMRLPCPVHALCACIAVFRKKKKRKKKKNLIELKRFLICGFCECVRASILVRVPA